MDSTEITDEELFALACEENEDAKNLLFERFKFVVEINLKKYKRIAKKVGVDWKDFESEAYCGFSDALMNYQPDKDASIATFINLCVNRRLKKFLIKESRMKSKVEKDAFSLEYVYEEFGSPLLELISDDLSHEPLNNITKYESYHELVSKINNDLSDLEKEVYTYLIDGFNYQQIAKLLKRDSKQIDNAIQRIKQKVKIILESK